jgi:hypothetical protein
MRINAPDPTGERFLLQAQLETLWDALHREKGWYHQRAPLKGQTLRQAAAFYQSLRVTLAAADGGDLLEPPSFEEAVRFVAGRWNWNLRPAPQTLLTSGQTWGAYERLLLRERDQASRAVQAELARFQSWAAGWLQCHRRHLKPGAPPEAVQEEVVRAAVREAVVQDPQSAAFRRWQATALPALVRCL